MRKYQHEWYEGAVALEYETYMDLVRDGKPVRVDIVGGFMNRSCRRVTYDGREGVALVMPGGGPGVFLPLHYVTAFATLDGFALDDEAREDRNQWATQRYDEYKSAQSSWVSYQQHTEHELERQGKVLARRAEHRAIHKASARL